MAFHFPLMPRMFMALHTEDRFPILDIMEQTPSLPDAAQWALFLRNHDELTLEMVTDEERDYMVRMYADDPQARINLGIRRRLAPLLGNNRRKIELMNGLLFSLPGTPVLYYGDEIGMGDNFYLGDRNGVRTPMQWSADRNAGFSQANAQKLYLPVIIDAEYHYEACNVDVQQKNPQSLLWWTKRLIALRKRSHVFGRGSWSSRGSENRKVLSFIRRHGDEALLVVANLSRFVQHVSLDLSEFAGKTPVEAFGRTEFPPVSRQPYSMILGPNDFYWFSLEPRPLMLGPVSEERPAGLSVSASWEEIFAERSRPVLERLLLDYAKTKAWTDSPMPLTRSASIVECLAIDPLHRLALVRIETVEGASILCVMALSVVEGEKASEIRRRNPQALLTPIGSAGGGEAWLCDGAADAGFFLSLVKLASQGGRISGRQGDLIASSSPGLAGIEKIFPGSLSAVWDRRDNAYIRCGALALKLFRRLEPGVSPDLEFGRFLTRRAFPHAPALFGAFEYVRSRGEPATIGTLHAAPPTETDAWKYSLDSLGSYFEKALANPERAPPPLPEASVLRLALGEIPARAFELIGPYLHEAGLLGERTAQLHRALASEPEDSYFAPEPFTWFYQRSLYQSLRTTTREVAQALRRGLSNMAPAARLEAQRILDFEEESLRRLREVHVRRITAMRLRCHGDLHLGRLFYTGKDFLFSGFEGDPSRSLNERRIKRSPLLDVASLIRSFHYAASLVSGENQSARHS
ncbi:MAG: alpha-glucosidase C-terminal domain-containing protein [Elusimicrobia bacterium]|nr:alpha-glucosidase C-terminal domain-containing protein [Elusimicrobiota bacterium]